MNAASTDIEKQILMNQMQILIRTEYILRTNQEDLYAEFLVNLVNEPEFMEFTHVIKEDIKAFGISDEEIQHEIAAMVPAI
ncbi:hypothetical protein [Metabacillus sp. cB07]|uniref:hypothetical protein n=1 Tax=Metabacillus sp. cB07 TaxID=2806989 RepID=UPI00193A29F9|nr:hypothetical protein [Metabacillus sp. cB07]